jgi:pyruvate-formate lyase
VTPRIARMRAAMLDGKHHVYRQAPDAGADAAFTASLVGLPEPERAVLRLAYVLDREVPVVLEDQRIVGLRTVTTVPEILTEPERADRAAAHRIHELGKVSNVSPDYAGVLRDGLGATRATAFGLAAERQPLDAHVMRTSVIRSIDAVLRWADRYADEAARAGLPEAAEALPRIAREGAQTFVEALQLLRLVHYALWCSFNYHNTFGRFDQYLWPYLEADLAAGRLNLDDALELVEEFFLACNLDSDLYPGVQQGDNGQSIVLGGIDRDGRDAWNPLTELCLQASLELELIDPKINLRVGAATPLDRFVSGTRLTAKGLGFPQYSNDDVVIPGLVALGYDEQDARDYVVAACWEFIIPGVGMDVPNIAALSFPAAVDDAVREALTDASDFGALMVAVRAAVRVQARALASQTDDLVMEPAPLLSALMPGCVERGRDASEGLRYNNYGIHGAGLSTAADSLAAIRYAVFDSAATSPLALLQALDDDFVGHEPLRTRLHDEAPKMGNDDDAVDGIAADLLATFADALGGLRNDRGGVFRAGTGSAMFYVVHAATLGATADGRRAGEYLSANLAPSLGVKVAGPLSVIRSFTKLPVDRAINGGPLTIELHSTVFRSEDSVEKVAMLVRAFIQAGGHQLQLNALDRATLFDAQEHPERHRNLIVRVWGWSAYFVELDRQYQDQIIQRVELTT